MNAQVAIRQALVNEEAQLNNQLNALVADGTIGMYTDTWNEWQEEIIDVKKSIVETDSALAELKQSILEIRFDNFEKSLDSLEQTSDMASSVRDLLSEEGIFDTDLKITDSGYTQLALMSTELISAKQRTVNYSAAIEALKKDLANGNMTQAQYNDKLKEYQKGQMDAVKSTKEAKDAILDLVKNGIEKQTEAMEDLIDKRKEELSVMKQTNDYQKEMSDKSKEINSIKAQVAVLEGDDSDAAIAQRKNLNSQLQKLQDEYDEKRKDREYDIISDGYDDLKEKFNENQAEILKQLEISSEAQAKAIGEVLEATKNKQAEVYDTLRQLSTEYQFTLTDSLTKPWESAQTALQQFQDAMGKLNANISIDTSKITTTTPSSNQTTPTKNEAQSTNQNNDKSKTGTWIKQDGRWWYQHDDGSYKIDGWEAIDGAWYKFDRQGWMQTGWQPWGTDSTGQTAWYYMNSSGAMAASQWIDDKYYVDHTGVMARNGYVKSKVNGTYYWVNGDGVWEPRWNTTQPDLNKYKLYYVNGTPNAKNRLAYMDDSDNSGRSLKLGSEFMITDRGVLGNFGGSAIFSEAQKDFLFEFSKRQGLAIPDIPDISDKIGEVSIPYDGHDESYDIHFDSLLTVNGDVDKEVFPGMKETCKEAFQYFTRKMKDISRKV